MSKRIKSSLKENVVYTGKVYSISPQKELTKDEYLLVNVSSNEGVPSPTRYATGTPDGERIFNQLLDQMEEFCSTEENQKIVNLRQTLSNELGKLDPVKDKDTIKKLEFTEFIEEAKIILLGKEVKFRIKSNGEYMNTSIYAPNNSKTITGLPENEEDLI